MQQDHYHFMTCTDQFELPSKIVYDLRSTQKLRLHQQPHATLVAIDSGLAEVLFFKVRLRKKKLSLTLIMTMCSVLIIRRTCSRQRRYHQPKEAIPHTPFFSQPLIPRLVTDAYDTGSHLTKVPEQVASRLDQTANDRYTSVHTRNQRSCRQVHADVQEGM